MTIFKLVSETGWELFWIALWGIFGGTDSGPVYSETSYLPIREAVNSKINPIMQCNITPSRVSSADQKMADMNKRILLHSSLQLYLSPNTPISFVICKNAEFHKYQKWNFMWGVGGGSGTGSWNASSPSPSPTLTHALKGNKLTCRIASPHLTTKASWIITFKRFLCDTSGLLNPWT